MPVDFLSLSGAIKRIPRRAREIRGLIAALLTDTYEVPAGLTARSIVALLAERCPMKTNAVYYHQRALRLAYQYYHASSEEERQRIILIKNNTADPLRTLVAAGITSWEQLMERVAKATPQAPEPPPPAPKVEPPKEEIATPEAEVWFAIPESQFARLERIGNEVIQALQDAEIAQVRLTKTLEDLRGSIKTLQEENAGLRARTQRTQPVPTLEDLAEKRSPFKEILGTMQQVSANRRKIQREALRAELPEKSNHHHGARVDFDDLFLDLILDLPTKTQVRIKDAVRQLCGQLPGHAPAALRPRKPNPGEVLGIEITAHTRVCDAAYDIRIVYEYLKNHKAENRLVLFRAVGQREGAYNRR